MNSDRIIVLGIGNILLTDEGVGVRAVQELQSRYLLSENVRCVDGGTQGLWLMSTIQEADHLIVVDAVMGGGEPGTIYRLERDDLPTGLRVKASAHDSDLLEALTMCSLLDASPKSVVVVGIQPQDIQTMSIELTRTLAGKMDEVVELVAREVERVGGRLTKRDTSES